MFKDTIFGINFLHGHYMAHRDIKPANIMKVDDLSWKLLDYGIGENIQVLADHSEQTDVQIQKGKFTLSGTPNYMAPILKSRYLAARQNVLEDVKMIDIDLFKADVYSLGLTFLQAATNLKIDKINESPDYMELAE